MSAEKTMFERIPEIFYASVLPAAVECLRLLPDSFVLGTAILAGLSMSKSYGILLMTMFELMLGQRAFAMIISGIAPIGAGENINQDVCQPGLSFPNNMRISLLEMVGTPSMFPSPTMFFLSGVIFYMLYAMEQFGRELKSLSGDIAMRKQVASVLSGLFMLVMILFRYSYGCESFGTLLVSIILGSLAGVLLVYQNTALFGKEGINILNVPIIQSAFEKGRPMYVCAPSNI
jgi:hypothetical protein